MTDVRLNKQAKKWRLSLLAFVLIVAQFGVLAPAAEVAEAADNGLGQKPYMGWSSFSMQVYTGQNTIISAASIKAQSDAMHELLQPYGYEYINIDAGWNGDMDGYGRPIPSTVHYPNGFQEVIDYVHANGQKIGIYGIPGMSPQAYEDDLPIYGAPGCSMRDIAEQPLRQGDYWNLGYKIDFSNPCSQKYIESIADLYGEWGIDFLKFDSVTPGSGISDLSLDARDDVKAWSEALEPHGIWLELSWALDINYIDYWKEYANGWRVDWDVECYCGTDGLTTWSSISRLFPKAEQWWPHGKPGGWNDFDSLNVGNGAMDGITQEERRTAMTLWAMSAAPLYIGNDMTNLDSFGLSLLTNEEVIAVNQNGRPTRPVSMETEQQVWYANNGDGSYTVALFNLGDSAADVTANWSDIGLTGPASVRDLWSKTELGTFNDGFGSANLASHASRLLRVTPQDGTVTANGDDHGFSYVGEWERNGGYEDIGGSQNLLVSIIDSRIQNSAIQPTLASFNKKPAARTDIQVALTLNGNTLSGVSNGGTALISGTDYAVSGSTLTIDADYLATLPVGETKLTIAFSAGEGRTLTIKVTDTTDGVVAMLNDDHPGITYSGEWNRSWNRGLGDYLDDVHFAEDNGDFFEYAFSGTGIQLLTEKHDSQGEIDIYIDGVFQETVDTYKTGDRLSQQAVFTATGLPDGPHTLKAVKKSGIFMLLDALKVTKPDLIVPAEGSFNKKTALQRDVTTELTPGGPALSGITAGGTALVSGTDYTAAGNVVTIKKEWLATQGVGAANLVFSFAGGATQLMTVTIADTTAQVISLNDTDGGISYNGSWGHSWSRGLGDYQDDVHYTEGNGNYFEYTFTGTGIEYLTEKDSSQGEVEIYLDGQLQGTFDTYSASRQVRQSIYSATGLAEGEHTLKVVKKSGSYMLLDELRVTSASLVLHSTVSPKTVTYDNNAAERGDAAVALTLNGNLLTGLYNGSQPLVEGTDYTVSGNEVTLKEHYLTGLPSGMNAITFSFTEGNAQEVAIAVRDTSRGRYVDLNDSETGIRYTGNWQHSRNRGFGDFKDDVHFAETNGAAFEYEFHGVGIELLTEMDTSQGEVDIYLDGQLQGTFSAQQGERSAQEPLYIATGLANGVHTLKAVKKSGSYMLLDALRVQKADRMAPDTGVFDKNPPEKEDLFVTLTVDGSNLTGVKNGSYALQQGHDYKLTGSQLKIKKRYLDTLAVGTAALTLSFKGDYKGDVEYTATNGDYVEYEFTGTGVKLIGPKGPEQGNIDIYVDGVFAQTVSAHSASRLTGQTIYTLSGLAAGDHTIKAVKTSGGVMTVDQVTYTVD
jgi:hypothetical protein